jgi:hypothetical protein
MFKSKGDSMPIHSTRCQFVIDAPTNVPRVIMAGEYPPDQLERCSAARKPYKRRNC